MEDKTVIVIGAVNVDICGRPDNTPRLYDSNIGSVSIGVGGVGRNIAHNLRLLGVKVKFLAAIGDDASGATVLQSCTALGMDMHLSRRIKGGKTSSYLYVSDEKGDMLIGICDTDIAKHITPEYLSGCIDELNAADALVIDGNLTEETLAWIAENISAPLYADPVSTAKAERLKPVLHRLCAFKPNELEAMSMTGTESAEAAADALLSMGVKRVFVSLGADGVLAAEGDEKIKLPCEKHSLVNATGCGDAASAAVIWADINGLSLASCAKAAMKAAALAIECEETVNPKLRKELII